MSRRSRLRGVYRLGWNPSVAECEQRILTQWKNLCAAVCDRGADSELARTYVDHLHDLGIIRARAMAAARALAPLRTLLRAVQP